MHPHLYVDDTQICGFCAPAEASDLQQRISTCVGINRKPVCDFLLVINSKGRPISYRFGVIAAYCSNFRHFAFLSHPLGGLGTTYDVHLVGSLASGLGLPINPRARTVEDIDVR